MAADGGSDFWTRIGFRLDAGASVQDQFYCAVADQTFTGTFAANNPGRCGCTGWLSGYDGQVTDYVIRVSSNGSVTGTMFRPPTVMPARSSADYGEWGGMGACLVVVGDGLRRLRARVAAVSIIVMAMCVLRPAMAQASFSGVPTTTWVTDGHVDAVAVANGHIFLGGAFSQVGPRKALRGG